jgi:hypothetical protein
MRNVHFQQEQASLAEWQIYVSTCFTDTEKYPGREIGFNY